MHVARGARGPPLGLQACAQLCQMSACSCFLPAGLDRGSPITTLSNCTLQPVLLYPVDLFHRRHIFLLIVICLELSLVGHSAHRRHHTRRLFEGCIGCPLRHDGQTAPPSSIGTVSKSATPSLPSDIGSPPPLRSVLFTEYSLPVAPGPFACAISLSSSIETREGQEGAPGSSRKAQLFITLAANTRAITIPRRSASFSKYRRQAPVRDCPCLTACCDIDISTLIRTSD